MNRYINKVVVSLFFVLGMYHLLMFCYKTDLISIDKQILFRIYHISYNLLIIAPIYFLYKFYNWHKRTLIILAYPTFKIIYNVVIFVPSVKRILQNSFVDAFSLVLLIIIIFVTLKTIKYNE
jgi:hypothetical protein